MTWGSAIWATVMLGSGLALAAGAYMWIAWSVRAFHDQRVSAAVGFVPLLLALWLLLAFVGP